MRCVHNVPPGGFSPKFLIGITNLECKSLRNSEPNPAHCIFFGRGSSVRVAIESARVGLLPFDGSCGEDAGRTRRVHRHVIHDPCIISVVPESDRHTWHAIEKEIHEHGTQSSMWVDSHWDQNRFYKITLISMCIPFMSGSSRCFLTSSTGLQRQKLVQLDLMSKSAK